MISQELISQLSISTPSKIVLLVMDGVGGLPHAETGKTELETANTPNLDAFASESECGLSVPVSAGIAPGSGPGHLSLFGYDPIASLVGRGILSALGVNFPIERTDVASRINFASIDSEGLVTDRRAGRISTEFNRTLVARLGEIKIPGMEVFIQTEAGHRAVVVFRGSGLSDKLSDTDPQAVGVPPLAVKPLAPDAGDTARLVNSWIARAAEVLKNDHPANFVLLRGFAKHPDMPSIRDIYKLNSAAVAAYPMYLGLAKLVGMQVLDTGATIAAEIETLKANWEKYDFFFVHYKPTDSYGEDGNFDAKVKAIEDLDRVLPEILALKPDAIAITGDHSTPSRMMAHSWHPVPFAIRSPYVISDDTTAFSERACARGTLGRFPAQEVMLHLMANALKMQKYGA